MNFSSFCPRGQLSDPVISPPFGSFEDVVEGAGAM